uniref:Disease resistance protein RPS2 n=1 Tax=Anthurium amnicola TaxID=1678845 RepID=A0A1D1ZGX8_9ARAE
MPLPACILCVVGWMCQPLMNAMQGSLETEAQGCFSHFWNWLAREYTIRRTAVVEEPASTSSIVGGVETLLEIKTHLSDERVGIIGIYGMGGIGKTTLLQRINNDFCESGTRGLFDLVIFVTVSQEINIHDIQRQIGERLGLSFPEVVSSSNQEKEQAKILFKELSKRRILLLIDNLWAKLDLVMVGIPDPKGPRRCKIAFTTRSQQVCTDMGADEFVRVKQLNKTQSWTLFCSKLRKPVDDPPFIRELAQQVVDKCGRLPLALITVGEAMANWEDPDEWGHAVESLDHYAEQLRGMDKVLSCLMFSFDQLGNDMKSALMYCAMYPEDKDINREELVEYWVGEGLLDANVGDAIDGAHIDEARRRGHVLIRKLKDASMLEAGIKDEVTTVRLHDCVRDMALYINRNELYDVDKFLVIDKKNLYQLAANNRKREHVRRIWVRDMFLEDKSLCIPDCPNTWTLLLSFTFPGASLLTSFFNFMKTTLRVLDLSINESLTELPVEIGLLVELRCLNLSRTSIWSLPIELGNLGRLRQLLLEETSGLREIPRQAVVGLSSLQVLNMTYCGYDWDRHGRMTSREVTMVEGNQQQPAVDVGTVGGGCQSLELSDLERLSQLQELHIDLESSQALKGILNSHMLCERTRGLRLQQKMFCPGDDPLYAEGGNGLWEAFRNMSVRYLSLANGWTHPWSGKLEMDLNHLSRLEELKLTYFSSEKVVVLLGTGVDRLRLLDLWSCSGLKKLELRGKFPCLERINVHRCENMVELVLHGDFPKVTILFFGRLWSLNCIGPQPLTLPSLETISVLSCRQLRSLPLGTGSAPKLKVILGEQEWWDDLQWPTSNGSNMKSIFAPCFIPRF